MLVGVVGTASGKWPSTQVTFMSSALNGRASPTTSVEATDTARKSAGASTPVYTRARSTSVGQTVLQWIPTGLWQRGTEGEGLEHGDTVTESAKRAAALVREPKAS